MDIIIKKTEDYKDFASCDCEVNCIHVQISDLTSVIQDFHNSISDTSWIDDLDELSQSTFIATSERTINKIVNEILVGITNSINQDVGEYIVSYVGQHVLATSYSHTKIPLAELLKEKVSGNSGFDFHTISTKRFIVFGEAKFSMEDTPRAIALNQIGEFISLKKDLAELNSFRPFLDEPMEKNIISGMKGYAAAFSFNADNIDTIFKNALDSDIILELIKHNELYLIAVEIC